MTFTDRPHPAPAPLEQPFWYWCGADELRIQRCLGCLAWRHPPRPRCPQCGGTGLGWERVSGRGVVWSFTICHPPVLPAFTHAVPYNAVVVRLEEGVFLVSNLIGCANEDIKIGMDVEAVLVRVDDELTLPQFRPV
jgi:uncharacterized OB-fold protein